MAVIADANREAALDAEREVMLLKIRPPVAIAVADEAVGYEQRLRDLVGLGIGEEPVFQFL